MNPNPVAVRERNGLFELTAGLPHERFYNEDLAPTTIEKRTWRTRHIASLWIGMCVCVPTYMLAASLLKSGMNWWQAILTITLGNAIVLVPMALNAHAGTKYGIPFPVLLRSSFGTVGSNVPAMARALVACGWFGIQTWIGGAALYELVKIMAPGIGEAGPIGFLGINGWQFLFFLVFWAINVYFILAGTESIKWLETYSAPLLIAMGVALLGWAMSRTDGLGQILAESNRFHAPSVQVASAPGGGGAAGGDRVYDVKLAPLPAAGEASGGAPRATEVRFVVEGLGNVKEVAWIPVAGVIQGSADLTVPASFEGAGTLLTQFRDGAGNLSSVLRAPLPAPGSGEAPGIPFLAIFLPSLTAMVGFWATLSLNIPDFTRYASSQRDQFVGQAVGLPPTMALYSFIGLAVTTSSLLVFPELLVHEDAPWDPVALLSRFKSPTMLALSMIALSVATLTTNIAANVVGPANDISNLKPERISFKMGGMITAFIGILMMPWKIIETTQGYIFTWLIGYGALLGPIGGIMIADYYVVRRARLNLPDLYRAEGEYRYSGGIHWRAIGIFVAAVAPNLPGFLAQAGFVDAAAVPEFLRSLYTYAWFVGFVIAFGLYALLTPRPQEAGAQASAMEPEPAGA